MLIWKRHLFFTLTKTFLFFFFCLVFLYFTIDLSVHGVRFFSKSTFSEVALYYITTTAGLYDLFLSFSFLLAALRVLFDLNQHRELIALQMAGLSKRQLLSPFFLFAILLTITSYINSQYFAPSAQETTLAFKGAHKPAKEKKKHVFSIPLEDNSTLVYQSFDGETLSDVFWIPTHEEIWHMKDLSLNTLVGHEVHHLIRNPLGQIEKKETCASKTFIFPLEPSQVMLKRTPFENRSLSTLFSEKRNSSALSHLHYKLFTPLTPLLLLFLIAPVSMRFSRNRPFFLIAAATIFGFIAFKVILDGMLILGENQVVPPLFAIWGLPSLLLLFSFPSFAKN